MSFHTKQEEKTIFSLRFYPSIFFFSFLLLRQRKGQRVWMKLQKCTIGAQPTKSTTFAANWKVGESERREMNCDDQEASTVKCFGKRS